MQYLLSYTTTRKVEGLTKPYASIIDSPGVNHDIEREKKCLIHFFQWLTGKTPPAPSFSNPNYAEEGEQKEEGEEGEEEEEGGASSQKPKEAAVVAPNKLSRAELPLIDNIWCWIDSKVLVLSNKGERLNCEQNS